MGGLGFIGLTMIVVIIIQRVVIKREEKERLLRREEDRDGDNRRDDFNASSLNLFEEELPPPKSWKEIHERLNRRPKSIVPVNPEWSWGTRERIRAEFEAKYEGSQSSDLGYDDDDDDL